jgi:hypothetical protein
VSPAPDFIPIDPQSPRDAEMVRRALEFFAKPENADKRLTPYEFYRMFDPANDGAAQ